jgi:hypothetical protein
MSVSTRVPGVLRSRGLLAMPNIGSKLVGWSVIGLLAVAIRAPMASQN